ncbi:MAG: pyridoxal phosphate-dependent aminotransferase, partial [Candidatus Omnitrophica bacterium]|nr:pyridoxal phosphate-dependent aminotransferase [Candidatus Omnitrophota bacterium]
MELSERVQLISQSETLSITSEIKKLKKEKKPVINFAAGEPDFDTPDQIKSAAKKSIDSGFTKYTPVAGIPELKEAIANKFKSQNNLNYAPDQIVVSNGAKHSIANVLFALLNPGDEVIIMAPYWLSYTEMVKLATGVPKVVYFDKKDGFRPDFKKISAALNKNTKCIILNSPANPTGMVWTKSELVKLESIALENNLVVISDEIYEHLIYQGEHISIGSLSDEIFKRTVTVNGVSKSHAMTGWRIGWIGADIGVAQAVSKIQGQMTSNPSSISQKAAQAALSMSREWFDFIKSEFKKRR